MPDNVNVLTDPVMLDRTGLAIAAILADLNGQRAQGRVVSLDDTELLVNNVVDAKGAPAYVDDVTQYADYHITDTGWYVFARIRNKYGLPVTGSTHIIGADGYIATIGADYIDVAVRFGVAGESRLVTIDWGEYLDKFIFRATDLALRNLDYRSTYYEYNIGNYATWTFALTADETFVRYKHYYTLEDGEYVPAEVVYGDPVTPHLRAIDGIKPGDYAFLEAAAAGVTSVCTGPGSSNVLGGTFAAIKTCGRRVDDMVIKAEVAMKCAFGENPKRCYKEKGISSRMSTAAKLREALFKAREYMEKLDAAGDDISKRPAFDLKLHALIPVLRREIPLKAHAHQANDILTAIRIAREFNVKLTLEHVTEGALIVDELVKADVPLAIGPTDGQPSKIELQHKSWETPVLLNAAGCRVSIITDSPVTQQSHLRLCAAMAVAAGMPEFDALKAVTINPARHIGVGDRVGSLEPGKDADFILTDGPLFALQTRVVETWIDGVRRS